MGILEENGISKIASIQTTVNGTTLREVFLSSLKWAAEQAPVVFSNLGPIDEALCRELSKFQNVVFVLTAGNDAMELKPEDAPSCMVSHIILVASMNESRGQLTSFSNWGLRVTLAGPTEISLAPPSTAATASVAARLAAYAKSKTDLKGSDLALAFLRDNTVTLPSLMGKVQGGRALKEADRGEY